jgi:hypothetical protein
VTDRGLAEVFDNFAFDEVLRESALVARTRLTPVEVGATTRSPGVELGECCDTRRKEPSWRYPV